MCSFQRGGDKLASHPQGVKRRMGSLTDRMLPERIIYSLQQEKTTCSLGSSMPQQVGCLSVAEAKLSPVGIMLSVLLN